MRINYEDFKTNPLLYILFLPLLAMVFLFTLNHNNNKREMRDKNRQIDRLEYKELRTDSINHNLYELLGAKKILDSLK